MGCPTLILPFLLLLLIDICLSASFPMRFDPQLSELEAMMATKRPFCNPFTGCGRKSFQGDPDVFVQKLMRQRQYVEEDDPSNIDSESNIEEFSRQNVMEAKLWEAIQQANEVVARRKQNEYLQGINEAVTGRFRNFLGEF